MPRNHASASSIGTIANTVAIAFVLWMPESARAATITVNTTVDTDVADTNCSLREAIKAANDDAAYNGCPAGTGADHIVFAVTLPAVILVTSDLPTITSTLAIQGPSTSSVSIDGQDLYRLLLIESDDDH